MLLQVKNLSYSRGSKPLFEHLDLAISARDRIGLVGHNGSGKSSLISVLAGRVEADQGERVSRRDLTVGEMEQFVPPPLLTLPLIDAVLERLSAEQQITDRWRAEAILSELGFSPIQLTQTIQSLSGGQQNLALFARVQLTEPDLLLMDEPGNHMDVSALASLKDYLNNTQGMTFVMISHDRELLDDCCDRTLFLRDRRIYGFQMPYSHARQALARQDEQAEHRHDAEQKEIDRIKASAKRLAIWGKTYDNEDLARKAKTMALRAEKLTAEQTFVTRGSGLELNVSGEALRSKTVFTLEKLSLATEDGALHLLDCDYLVAKPGDRIALLGTNGCGKSTTIRRMLRAFSEDDPAIRFNPQTQIGYFDQELAGLDTSEGRFDWLRAQLDVSEETIKQTLLHAGIAYRDFGQAVTTLSGGEKARLRFMLLALQQANLMILDEPTNHIDLESREQLEKQLIEANTTLLVTSHDRTFLEAVCDRFWLIEDQALREIEYLNTYYETLHKPPHSSVSNHAGPATQSAEEGDLLERIQYLEDLLASDEARKPKFQKPQRQAEWRAELDKLWAEATDDD